MENIHKTEDYRIIWKIAITFLENNKMDKKFIE